VSVIRIGDYKLMRHLNSGELKLFNVATDYTELQDLAQRTPEKTKEMDQILRQYVEKVDGGTMPGVYAAYFEWLDEGLRKKQERYQRELETLKEKNPADFEKQRAGLDTDLRAAKREHAAKTAICKDQMTNPSWRDTRKNEVVKRIGVDKKGNLIESHQ
jgi:hypothetical protein